VPWTGPAPDLAVDLHGRGAPSHRLLSALHPRRLIAFADPEGGYPHGPSWRADEHEVRRWCRLLEEEGIASDPEDLDLIPSTGAGTSMGAGASTGMGAGTRLDLRPNPNPDLLPHAPTADGVLIVHPGAASASRRWGASRFATVARELGGRVLITAGPGEERLGAEVVAAAGLPEDALITGLGLDALAALVARAALVVSGDTGIAHLATAVRTPSVVLSGPVPPAEWGPPARPWHVALWHGHPGYRGDPHGTCIDPALDAITPTEVLDAARRVLAAGGVMSPMRRKARFTSATPGTGQARAPDGAPSGTGPTAREGR
jgi:hypothetical protein